LALPVTVTRCRQYSISKLMRSRPMTHLTVATISGTTGMRLIHVAICMSIKKLSKSNWVLTVCHVWTFLIGSTRVSAMEGHLGLPKHTSCSFFSQNLVISFITRGDITWQESSQCVTEQCWSVRPSVTCFSSVLAFAHARSPSSETTRAHNSIISNSEPFFASLNPHVISW
jgi:hypothetical protein